MASADQNQSLLSERMATYKVGDRDQRPWGSYVVTGVGYNEAGEEYCEKEITVHFGQILSLQSHEMRREIWIVKQGTLTALLDGQSVKLSSGGIVQIPQKSIHCMANLGTENCVVYERQEGIYREEDIQRYADAYGRSGGSGVHLSSPAVTASIAVYNVMVAALRKADR
ncbi:MAG: phosphomannose isomerase type II C-terminal cupin domain [Proteobacteria bacterium]|nr:phosphomannose isomerase type II C-terminal cupin domain [Pseudomonadota bacterium]